MWQHLVVIFLIYPFHRTEMKLFEFIRFYKKGFSDVCFPVNLFLWCFYNECRYDTCVLLSSHVFVITSIWSNGTVRFFICARHSLRIVNYKNIYSIWSVSWFLSKRIPPLILMTMLNMMYDDGRMRIFYRTILLKFSHLSEYQLTPAPALYSVYPQLTRGDVSEASEDFEFPCRRCADTKVPPTQRFLGLLWIIDHWSRTDPRNVSWQKTARDVKTNNLICYKPLHVSIFTTNLRHL